MKAYKEKQPALVIGGKAGSFLGEYQAGGTIIVLGLDTDRQIVRFFPCTGMHGGRMFIRSDCRDIIFPDQVTAQPARNEELTELRNILLDYCAVFHYDIKCVMDHPFTVVSPDTKNPYQQMYVTN